MSTFPFEIKNTVSVPYGYFLLEYVPDDGRGFPAHTYKTLIIGFALVLMDEEIRCFPTTLHDIYFYEKGNPPTILCPCGGVQCSEVFLDDIDDFMNAMKYRHEYATNNKKEANHV